MLIEFSVANFRSIRSRQTLVLTANGRDRALADNVGASGADVDQLLRSAVIYGPNAAGKSNLVRALQTLQNLILHSAVGTQEGQVLPVTPFALDQATSGAPSEFGLVFVAADEVRYEYFCAVSSQRVEREWLVAYPKGRPQRWFERELDAGTGTYAWRFGHNFKGERAQKKFWQHSTRANALFFSTAIQLNNDQLKPAFHWVAQQLIVLPMGTDWNPFLSLELLREEGGAERALAYLRAADVGIDGIELKEEEFHGQPLPGPIPGSTLQLNIAPPPPGVVPLKPLMFRVLTAHRRNDGPDRVQFDLSDESDGTRKLYEYAGGWIRALTLGATLFVDELDRSLHPFIMRFLVGLFHGEHNSKNAQLLFTTHDTTLLDANLLRRDQVWFVEKDEHQSTKLYPLLDFSPRNDEALERGYLKGRYGGVPLVGRLGG